VLLPSIIRILTSKWMQLAKHVAEIRKKKKANEIFMRKPEGKRLLGIPGYR
jgi:hypothetical protein